MGRDKLWIEVAGRPLLGWTLTALASAGLVEHLTVVAPRPRWEDVRGLAAGGDWSVAVCEGGDRRQDSVRAGLDATPPVDVVAVHDAARPGVTPGLLAAVLDAAREHGAATAAIPVVDSVTRVDATGAVLEAVPRAGLWAVQTPQAFAAGLLAEAHARALADGVEADDDAALVARLGHRVQVVQGDRANLKITHDDDLAVFRARHAAQ